MMPELIESRICDLCNQVIIHPNTAKCPECEGTRFTPLKEIVDFYYTTINSWQGEDE